MPTERAEKIAGLNDRLRKNWPASGRNKVLMAGALAKEPPEVQFRVMALVAGYDRFTPDNDPYGEHDMGTFEFEGSKMLWKIDYYDNDLSGHSPDETDPEVTIRVLTICYAFDY